MYSYNKILRYNKDYTISILKSDAMSIISDSQLSHITNY